MNIWAKRSGQFVYASRWALFPLSIGLLLVLIAYIVAFLANDFHFLVHSFKFDAEYMAVLALTFVDAYMVANLMLMILQGSFQIFIQRFEIEDPKTRAQWLDHIDSGLLKVKVAQSIGSIMFIRLLTDFVNIEKIEWSIIQHRLIMFGVALVGAAAFAGIWRITHPEGLTHDHEN